MINRSMSLVVLSALLVCGFAIVRPATATENGQTASAPAASLPQLTPAPLFLDTFLCECEATDPCTGNGFYASKVCQVGQQCICRTFYIDYQDPPHSCAVAVSASCR